MKFIYLYFICLLYSFTHAEISMRAAQLNLSSTWSAPMPMLNETSLVSAFNYIIENWATPKKYMYGPEDINFVQDPIGNGTNTTVLQVLYPANSFAPAGAKEEAGIVGGVEFVAMPDNGTFYNTALLSYDLAFDSNFDWVKGGKLPGLYGGSPGNGCSGGAKADGNNCFSMRMMWRANGAGEAYGYIPDTDEFCQSDGVICNSDYGTSFSRGVITFRTNEWTNIQIYTKLNSGNAANGILEVWQDGALMINHTVQYRANQSVGISSLMFSTFFGGSTVDYATPVNTSTFFKNIQLSVGNTPDPESIGVAILSSFSSRTLLILTTLSVLLNLFI